MSAQPSQPIRPVFPGHTKGCQYPFEHCGCGALTPDASRAYRRQRERDLDRLGSGKLGILRTAVQVKLRATGEIVATELFNEQRRVKNQLVRQLHLSPRQLKKERRKVKARDAAARAKAREAAKADARAGLVTEPRTA